MAAGLTQWHYTYTLIRQAIQGERAKGKEIDLNSAKVESLIANVDKYFSSLRQVLPSLSCVVIKVLVLWH